MEEKNLIKFNENIKIINNGLVKYEDEEGKALSVLSALTPEDMKYENVDAYETIAPYKDRLIWKIDGASTREFPDNVAAYRRFQLD